MEEAVRSGDLKRVQELIRSGEEVSPRLSVGIGSLLMAAISNSNKDIALALLAAGADVHVKDASGRTALHLACTQEWEEVVQALIDAGGRVDEPDVFGATPLEFASGKTAMCLLRAGASCKGLTTKQLVDLFHQACAVGDLSNVQTLLENGCSVRTLSKVEQEQLLRCACRNGDTLVAGTLLRSGCSVSSLSKEGQEELLRCALNRNEIFIARSVLRKGCVANKLSYKEAFYLVEQTPDLVKEELLDHACDVGDTAVVEALIDAGCNVNCRGYQGDTPIMRATCEGHEEIVKKLILAGANLAKLNDLGYTALHYAASHKHIQCGILLAEAGASLSAKNDFSETPLDVGGDFKRAITQALSFTTRKTLCIIGNAEGGKSTLITSLQAEGTGSLSRIINRFRRVEDCRHRTAGIDPVPHSSQKYGEVLFFDFAGQIDYHGPHQMFLEALLSKPGVSVTLLLVIKMTEDEDAILHQLHRWLTPVALMATPASLPQVIVIGSFLDKVKSKEEAMAKLIKCILAFKKNLEEFPLKFVGTCFLNCRQPQSEGIDQLCTFLQEVPVPEFSAIHTRYSLAWVLSQIRSSITAQAVQLQDLSAWIKGNEDNLPQSLPPPEEVCQDLTAAGHALYLPDKDDSSKSWLVLNLPSILQDIYGTLFSNSKEFINEFGLLHCCHLVTLFPDFDLAMVQQLLISLEFCIAVDPSILKADLSKLTQSEETSGWLFFPALISAKHPQLTTQDCPEQSVCSLCWQLRTSKKHFISARLLQTILLRLAAHFVVKQRNEDGIQQHYCSIWWNGITWMSTVGVDVTVHIMNNRVIQVIATSMITDRLCQYLSDIVIDILSTVHQLSPKLQAAAYIVHPPPVVAPSSKDITALPPIDLFPVEGIRDSIRDHDEFVLSLKDSDNQFRRTSVTSLFHGHAPTLETIERIIWAHPAPNQPQQSPVETLASGAQALLDTTTTPNMRDMDELVVTFVACNWQRLALRLGVEGCVSEVVFKNHPNDCEGACRDMLGRWVRGDRHTGEEERTWSTLLTALGRAGFEELERTLQRKHFNKC